MYNLFLGKIISTFMNFTMLNKYIELLEHLRYKYELSVFSYGQINMCMIIGKFKKSSSPINGSVNEGLFYLSYMSLFYKYIVEYGSCLITLAKYFSMS